MTALTLPAVPMEGGLARYFREIWTFPMLEKEEEQMLAIRWRDKGDVSAAHRMVTSHLRLVAKIAMKYRGYGLPVADLVSEGNIGLMKAVKKFDPDLGFRLSTYAMWWIRAAITEYILRSWSMVKLGTVASQKKLFFSLRSLKSRLNILDSGDLTAEQADEISDAVGVSADDVVNMNRRLGTRDLSLNAPVGGDEEGIEFLDALSDDRPNPEVRVAEKEEHNYRSALVSDAIKTLPERERRIFVERQLKDDPVTLEELGQEYGISRERVRQIEARAFEKVQKAVQAAVAEGARA
ncbi:MAG TPA: RNA polymerase sigma factor RpoH [Rhodospirillales bacterium]